RLVILAESLPHNAPVANLLTAERAKIRAALEGGNLLHDLRPRYTVDHLLREIESACHPPKVFTVVIEAPDNVATASPSPA
ncbi:MAG: hypothetical protein HY975_04585, partial [Candidatus Kerfeldbacteria bacterium]|nr:hypothetical protein [Candidatus Kerfeldbacteria bacterium]